MKLERVTNTRRGIRYGLINRFVGVVLPFVIQTIMIRQLGIKYIGLKGLFSSILTVLSLAELGLGNAIVYAMYKPIAEDNEPLLCSLLNYYKRTYRKIGGGIFVLGIILIPFIPYLIKGDYPTEINIKLVFFLYLLNTVVSYWMFAYKSSLLYAYQRTDILSIINTITQVSMTIFQMGVLLIFQDFYFFLFISILFTIINNLIVNYITNKLFPNLKCMGILKEEVYGISSNVKGILISKICNTTRNTFDSIFISAFLGLIQTAIYSNYYYIITAINGFTIIALTSLTGGIGNSIALCNKDKNYKDMMNIDFAYLSITGIVASALCSVYQPFMKIWMGDKNLFPDYIMILFIIYFYISHMGDIRGVYSDAAGLFWENRIRYILEAIANILLNVVLGRKFGVVGIILGTLISLFIFGFVLSAYVLFGYYFVEGLRRYFVNQFILLLCAVISCCLTYSVCYYFLNNEGLCSTIIRGLISLLIAMIVYWCILHNRNEYKEVKTILKHLYKYGK